MLLSTAVAAAPGGAPPPLFPSAARVLRPIKAAERSCRGGRGTPQWRREAGRLDQGAAGAPRGRSLHGTCLPAARGCGPVPLGWATAQRGYLLGVVGLTPRRPRALGGGPGEGRAQKRPTPMGAALCPAVGGIERKLGERFGGSGGRRGDGGHQAAAVAKVRPRPTAHSSALAPPDQRPLSAAVGWWWCARVTASGGGAGTRPAPGRVVGAPFAVLKAALWPAVAALCRLVGLPRSGGISEGWSG